MTFDLWRARSGTRSKCLENLAAATFAQAKPGTGGLKS